MNKKKKIEFSKFLVILTGILFILVLVSNKVFAYLSLDTSFATQEIITIGGIFGATIIFYLNKAKLENAIKIKVAFFKFKEEYKKENNLSEEEAQEIDNEFNSVEETIDNKVNDTISESVNSDISII